MGDLYLVRHLKMECYLCKRYDGKWYWDNDINYAERFPSEESVFDFYKNIDKYKVENFDPADTVLWKYPSSDFKPDETPIMICSWAFEENYEGNTHKLKDGRLYGCWDLLAIKEITKDEALAEFTENKDYTEFFFWDDDKRDPKSRLFVGYDYNTKQFVATGAVAGGYYDTFPHCGRPRTIDSGYRLPIYEEGDKIKWVNAGNARRLLHEGKITKLDLKPAFKTSIDYDSFMSEVLETKI